VIYQGHIPKEMGPVDFAGFYGLPREFDLESIGLERAWHAHFVHPAGPAQHGVRSVLRVISVFSSTDAAKKALRLLPEKAATVLLKSNTEKIDPLPSFGIGAKYGWGWSMRMRTSQGVELFRAEYGWQRGAVVANVVVFGEAVVAEKARAVAIDFDRRLNGEPRSRD
jgi:hypothetical protein